MAKKTILTGKEATVRKEKIANGWLLHETRVNEKGELKQKTTFFAREPEVSVDAVEER